MRAMLPVLFVAVLGCGERVIQPAAAPTAAPIAPVAPEPLERGAPVPTPTAPNRCTALAKVEAQKPFEVSEGDTCVDHRAAEAAVAKRLKKEFRPTRTGSRVEVSFGCDPLTAGVTELVFEVGSGHGGGLRIWRLTRAAESDREFQVVGYAYSDGRFGKSARDVLIARGSVPSARVEKALGTALPALTATIREIEPPPNPKLLLGGSGFMSSGNFHHYVRVRDEFKHQIERTWAGYPGSSGQRDYLGLEIAVEQLTPLVEKIEFVAEASRDDDKRFFVSMFLGAQPRLEAQYAWWVHERYLKLAGELGTTAILPVLLDDLRQNLAAKPEDASAARMIETELELVAKLTGWDARNDETGAKRPVAEVAREVLTECDKSRSQ